MTSIPTTGPATLRRAQREDYGFLPATAVDIVAADPQTRLFMLLIRWHEGRALVPAQDVERLIASAGNGPDGWNVRDVSIPAGATIPEEG